MRVVIIGGTGHIGSYLTPRLFAAGHTVICVSRGLKEPYQRDAAWPLIERVEMDRTTEEDGDALASALRGWTPMRSSTLRATSCPVRSCWLRRSAGPEHIFCTAAPSGSMDRASKCQPQRPSREGPSATMGKKSCDRGLPTAPGKAVSAAGNHPAPRTPGRPWLGSGKSRGQLQHGDLLQASAGKTAPAPQYRDGDAASRSCRRCGAVLPTGPGAEKCCRGRELSAVSPAAVTLRGYAERVGAWFGHPVQLEFLPWEEWRQGVPERDAAITWDHIAHSPNCSIAKARTLLGYEPRYSSLQAVRDSVDWLIAQGIVQAA